MDRATERKSGGETRSSGETAPLKPKDGLSGPPAGARASLRYGHRKEDWSIALVRWPHSRGLPPAS